LQAQVLISLFCVNNLGLNCQYFLTNGHSNFCFRVTRDTHLVVLEALGGCRHGRNCRNQPRRSNGHSNRVLENCKVNKCSCYQSARSNGASINDVTNISIYFYVWGKFSLGIFTIYPQRSRVLKVCLNWCT